MGVPKGSDIAAVRDALMKQHPGLIPFTENIPVTGILQPDERLHALKRRDFARWQASEKLPDTLLCRAINEMEQGLVDADLGQCLYKKRVARLRPGQARGLSHIGFRPYWEPLCIPARVLQERQSEHHAGRKSKRSSTPGRCFWSSLKQRS